MAPNSPHQSFDGIILSADGNRLALDYSDPDQGGTRLYFRYILSLHSPPRLIAGYAPHGAGSEREISFDEIPAEVVGDARTWLKSNAETAREQEKTPFVDFSLTI